MTRTEKTVYLTRIPQIQTDRLLLRKISPADAGDMYEYASLSSVTRYLLWYEHPNLLYTKRYITYIQSRYRTGQFFDFAVVCRENGKMIGTCGFSRIDAENDAGEIGFVFNPKYHKNGYATEAVRAMIQFGFERLGLYRIEGRYMKENVASRHVMERSGMIYEGMLHGLMKIKGKQEDVGICACIRTCERCAD